MTSNSEEHAFTNTLIITLTKQRPGLLLNMHIGSFIHEH